MYKAIDVWKRSDDTTVVRYRCFQVLPQNRFCVQSVDYYRIPLNKLQIEALDRQFLELLLEEAPDDRNKTYNSLEEAIAKYDEDFAEFEDHAA